MPLHIFKTPSTQPPSYIGYCANLPNIAIS